MTTGGIIVMFLSVGFVTGLFAFCLWRVLRSHRPPDELAKVEPVSESEVDRR